MPRHSRAEKEWKRRAVAAGVIAGQRTTMIARDLGCSRRHVRRLAAETETRFLIAETLRPFVAQLVAPISRMLTAIGEGLVATKNDKADHLTRLRAVERSCELLELAEGGKHARRGKRAGR